MPIIKAQGSTTPNRAHYEYTIGRNYFDSAVLASTITGKGSIRGGFVALNPFAAVRWLPWTH